MAHGPQPFQGNGAYLVSKTFFGSRLRRFGSGTVINNSWRRWRYRQADRSWSRSALVPFQGTGCNGRQAPRASLRSALGCALAARWAENLKARWAENLNACWAEAQKGRGGEALSGAFARVVA